MSPTPISTSAIIWSFEPCIFGAIAMDQTSTPYVPQQRRRLAHLSADLRHATSTSTSHSTGESIDRPNTRTGASLKGSGWSHAGNHRTPGNFINGKSSLSNGGLPLEISPPRWPATINSFAHSTATPKNISSDGSSSYRSVIDDLTIENRRLREEIRKYKAFPRQHSKESVLFEIKTHGLPPDIKEGLIETLLAYATTYDGVDGLELKRVEPTNLQVTSASCNSAAATKPAVSPPIDSAYASILNSGLEFASTRSHISENTKADSKISHPDIHKRDTILDGVPACLMPPTRLVSLTERDKKKYVVRRLEELFAGNVESKTRSNSQPMLQQEISKSAAQADRDSAGGVSLMEGVREAQMLAFPFELENTKEEKLSFRKNPSTVSGTSSTGEESDFPNQRPTRPLDLDPERAQIPSENIDYIRHLGLSTPKFSLEGSAPNPDANGWMYLNLLMSMAQLHIINVTPDFVRKAVAEGSEKFQLSKDGHKIRWRGSAGRTRLSSDSENGRARHQSPQDSDSMDEPERKRCKVSVSKGGFHYKPLFHRVNSSCSGTSIDESECSAPYCSVGYQDKPGKSFRRSLDYSQNLAGKQAGAITFYRGARYFSDLSGDTDPTSVESPARTSEEAPMNESQDMLGSSSRLKTMSRAPSESPPGSVHKLRCSSDLNSNRSTSPESISGLSDIDFPPEFSLGTQEIKEAPLALNLSGIGRTQAADHFLWKVQTRRTVLNEHARIKLSKFSAPGPRSKRLIYCISQTSLNSFQSSKTPNSSHSISSEAADSCSSRSLSMAETIDELPVKTTIIRAQFTRLEPSPLPAPSNFYAGNSSSGNSSPGNSSSANSSVFSGESSSFVDTSHWKHAPSSNKRSSVAEVAEAEQDSGEMEDNEAEDDDSTTDSSIDLLALEHELDPGFVAMREQAFRKE